MAKDEDETPQPDPKVEALKETPEGMLRTFKVNMGDVLVGISKELPEMVIMHIVPAEIALAIPLEMAYNIHDGLCSAINILDQGASLDLDSLEVPDDPKEWN